MEGLSFQNFGGQLTIQRRANDEQTREDWLHSSQIKWGKCTGVKHSASLSVGRSDGEG